MSGTGFLLLKIIFVPLQMRVISRWHLPIWKVALGHRGPVFTERIRPLMLVPSLATLKCSSVKSWRITML
jgi:hypothetical protein